MRRLDDGSEIGAGPFLALVTPVLLTYNEAPNIGRTLERLRWAREVVVVDSGSDDGTQAIIAGYPNARCVHRAFDNHAQQWNFAVHQTGIATEWVLALDADYVLSEAGVAEIGALAPPADVAGYQTSFRYCVWGKPLRGTLYPPVTTLYRPSAGRYEQSGHTQRLSLTGTTRALSQPIFHDDRKPLSRWLWAQDRYAALEAAVLWRTPWRELRHTDRLRKMVVVAPWIVPLYCLILRGGLLDGRAGLFYALQRGIAESVIALKLLELHFSTKARP